LIAGVMRLASWVFETATSETSAGSRAAATAAAVIRSPTARRLAATSKSVVVAEGDAVTLRSFAMPSTLAEHATRLNLAAPHAGRLPPLIMVTDERRLPDPVPAVAQLRAGDAILLRHYDTPNRQDLAVALARACRAACVKLIVAADLNLARTVGADGVHYPENLIPRGTRPPATANMLLTVAAHNARALNAAARVGADAALLSPVFPTESHPGSAVLGISRFVALVRSSPVPVYAMGGVSESSAQRLNGSGAIGIAAVGAFRGKQIDGRQKERADRSPPFPIS